MNISFLNLTQVRGRDGSLSGDAAARETRKWKLPRASQQ